MMMQIPFGLIDIAVFVIALFVLILLCGYCNKGGRAKTYVYRKTPTADKVEGIGGSRDIEHSYYDERGAKGPLPIGFSTTPEREKPETYAAYKDRKEEDHQKETES